MKRWVHNFLVRIEAKLDLQNERLSKIMATLDDTLKILTDEKSVVAGISTLVSGLKQQLADALAGTTLPPKVQAQVDAVFAEAQARSGELATALSANTPTP